MTSNRTKTNREIPAAGRAAISAVIIACGLLAGTAGAVLVPEPAASDTVDPVAGAMDPEVELANARTTLPFTPKLPHAIPGGFSLIHVRYDTTEYRGLLIGNLDVRYSNGQKSVHIWQTNNPFLHEVNKDPITLPGQVEEVVDDERWLLGRADGFELDVLNRRTDDGLTVSMDASSLGHLRAFAAQLK